MFRHWMVIVLAFSLSGICAGSVYAQFTPTLYRALNLNGAATTIDGNSWEASSGASNFSYTTNGWAFNEPGITLNPSTDTNRAAMIRSSIWGNPINLNVTAVPNGSYDVYVYVWEDNSPASYSVFLEGLEVLPAYNSGSAGTWSRLGPFRTSITDGAINLTASGGDANISGLEIWTAPGPPPVLSNALANQVAVASQGFTFTVPANTFTDPDDGQLSYSATLFDGSALPSWLTFNASTRTFSGTPSNGDAAALQVKVKATDDDGGSAHSTFLLTINTGVYALYRAINLNGSSLAIDGNTWEASAGAANVSISNNGTLNQQNAPLSPPTDANRATMIRSSVWGSLNLTIGSMPAGTYAIWVYVWEDTGPITYSFSLEGISAVSNYNSGAAGEWAKLGPFVRTINDGTLNLSVNGSEAILSGIEVYTVNSLPVVSNPIADQTATASQVFSYAFPENTFSDPDAGTTLTYTATLSDGNPLPSWLTFTPATRSFSGTPTYGDVGVLDIRVTASDGGGGTVNDIFQLTVNVPPFTPVLYRALNLNGSAITIDGNGWEASAGASNFSYTQANGGTFANQSITLVPATDANRATMIRSSIWGNTVNLNVTSVPNGSYDVYLYVWEDNDPVNYSVSVEGNVVVPNHNSGSAGAWNKLGPFRINLTDGAINVSVNGGHANVSGLEIWSAPNPPVVTQPLADQLIIAGEAYQYTVPSNAFTDPDPGTVLNYSATLADGSALPTWLSFNAATRTFSGTPSTGNAAAINIKVTVTDESNGSASDVFMLTINTGVYSLYRAINLNGPALTIDGNAWEASGGAANFTITDNGTLNLQDIPLNPPTDASRASMIRSSVWGNLNLAMSSMPAGSYAIWVYTWEDNFPAGFSFTIEGTAAVTNFNSGPIGTWTKHGPFLRTINDGSLNLAVEGGDGILSGIEVYSVDGSAIPVTGVTVSPATLSLTVGQTGQLGKNISPANATNQNVTWVSGNPAVATIDAAGLVTAVSPGTATITVATVGGNFTATASVTVEGPPLASGYELAWNEQLGVRDNAARVLTKLVANGWDNAGANSENQLAANQDGWFEFRIDNATHHLLMGLSTLPASYLRTSVEYGLEIVPQNQQVLYHESSESGVALGSWSVGDVFRIGREGGVIKYYRNGVEIRSAAVDVSKVYKIKALINTGGTFPAIASFWIPSTRGLVPDAWEFAALKDLYDSLDGASWTNKTSWGAPNNWVTNITAAQMNAWYGITVASGDITRVLLRSNNLSGKIPSSIGTLTSLRQFMVDYNNLTGSIPSSIGNLTQLEWLFLHRNSLTGDLPASMGNLTKMLQLAFHFNDLRGNIDWIGNMPNLVEFWFRANPNLDCAIPASIGNLTKLIYLIGGGFISDRNYVQMKMHGEIPASIANCTKLEFIYLDNSNFSGVFPNLSPLTNLRSLSVFNNPLLTGDLATTTAGLTKLSILYTFNTGIGGSIPALTGFNTLGGFDISNSQSRGAVPSFSGAENMEWIGLEALEIESIPDWSTSLPLLWYLNVNNNLLTNIPSFANHVNKANLELYAANNALDLATIEANFTAAGVHPFKIFEYAPQRNPVPVPATIAIATGQELKITAPLGGAHGVYLWEKLVNGTWTNVNSQNQSSVPNEFVRTSSETSDDGTYRYTVSNSWVPGLSFESGPIEVLVEEAPVSSVNALYNGIITSVRWRTDQVYGSDAEEFKGMYVFDYDDKYQVEDASWATPNFALNTFQYAGNKFRTTGMSYDPNGNIQSLTRYNENGLRTNNFTYRYGYQKPTPEYNNQLQSVEGYVNAYTYNAIGQTISVDKTADGEDQYIEYDVTGKVRFVYSDEGKQNKKVEYLYDDRGFRLAKIAYSGNEARTTWYLRDASGSVMSIYEQAGLPGSASGLTQTEVPIYGAGKLGTYYPAQDASVDYELTDHLGNVRALLREGTMVMTATMEDSNQEDYSNPRVQEMAYFQNLFETEVNDANMNHTSGTATTVQNPSRSAYLFWQDGVAGIEASDKAIGPAMARSVTAGDIITAEVYARYENKAGYTNEGMTLSALSTLMANTFASVAGFEGMSLPQTVQSFSNALGAGAFLDDTDDEVPYAYLNYIIFDEQMGHVASDRKRVTEDGGFDPGEESLPNMHEHISFDSDIVIPAEGKYIYIWVSNESENTKVWFDDLRISHASTFVAQATDYGVWGDVIREEKSDVLMRYRYAYQGQYAEKDEETGWNHFELREYDETIGRWLVPDPHRQHQSPYLAFGNNPVNRTDPNGGKDWPVSKAAGFSSTINVEAGPRSVVSYDGVWTMLDGGDWAQLNLLNAVDITSRQSELTVAPPVPWSLRIPGFSVLGGVLSRVSAILAASTILKGDESEKYITLYRGVHVGHPDYSNALKGMAVPAGGDANEEEHNLGNYESIFTSWTPSKSVANWHANKHGSGGLVLEKRFKWSQTVPSPDYFSELEMLVPGVVKGAKVGPPSGPGSRRAY